MVTFLKQNWIKMVLVLLLGTLFLFKEQVGNLTETAVVDQEESVNKQDPLKIANCFSGAYVFYWDFVDDNPENFGTILRSMGNRDNNFYIRCESEGSSGVVSVYLFKNNQPIFERESIYHGNAFMGEDSSFYIIEGNWGEANCCPRSYNVEQYTYNQESESMELVKTIEYPTYEIKRYSGGTTHYNKDLYDFEQKNSIEYRGDWGGFDWTSIK